MEGETGGEITKRNKKSKWGNRRMYEYVCVVPRDGQCQFSMKDYMAATLTQALVAD